MSSLRVVVGIKVGKELSPSVFLDLEVKLPRFSEHRWTGLTQPDTDHVKEKKKDLHAGIPRRSRGHLEGQSP
mgnify:CR=1 FL=1